MIAHSHLLNLRRIAIANVMDDDIEFYIEKCFRYYSKTYHTPLHVVKEVIPIEEVVKVFMEDELENFTAEEMQDFKKVVDETPKIYVMAPEFMEQEEMSEDIWIAQQTALLKQQEEKEKKAKAEKDIIAKTHQAIDKLTESINTIPKTKKAHTVQSVPNKEKK